MVVVSRIALVLFAVLSVSLQAASPELAPLAKYVAKPDTSFKWTKQREGNLNGTQYVELIMTSQTWRGIPWKHQMFVLKPSSVPADAKHAMLFISGGGWKPEIEDPNADVRIPREGAIFAAIAEQLKTPVAVLLHVPHQPIFDGKVEDQIIAYTFDEYLKTGDPEWPLLLPMVKSAVRGMDAVQQYSAQNWKLNIETFTVTGASKRGWTTWLTGAVDSRAVAIAPMVIDVLNMREQMKLQRESFGKPSEEIQDYTERGLTERLESKEAVSLREIIDPYSYREQYKQPKLIILGTNDRYWPLDALNLYWKDLPDDKYVMYIPNNGHGLKDIARLTGSLTALHRHIADGQKLPKLSWEFTDSEGSLKLIVKSDIAPLKVDTWTATAASRDFRNSEWTSKPARKEGDHFVCELEKPASGYAAVFGELVFNGQPLPYFLSTNVRITPASPTGGE